LTMALLVESLIALANSQPTRNRTLVSIFLAASFSKTVAVSPVSQWSRRPAGDPPTFSEVEVFVTGVTLFRAARSFRLPRLACGGQHLFSTPSQLLWRRSAA